MSFDFSIQPITTEASDNMDATKPSFNAAGLPRIPLNLSDHKLPIAINWSVIVISSGILPIVGYFALAYATSISLTINLSIWLSIMGVPSIFALLKRTWFLVRKDSTCRPLGAGRWSLDYFCWNFIFGFALLTTLICLATSLSILQLASLPTAALVLYVCVELLLARAAMAAGIRAPFRFSSLARGEKMRPGAAIVVEDVVAVDGGQGQEFRRAWIARYEASPVMQTFLQRMDLLWGASGLAVVAVIFGVVFGVENKDVGYAVGWGLPWIWAAATTVLTIDLAKRMLRREEEMQRQSVTV